MSSRVLTRTGGGRAVFVPCGGRNVRHQAAAPGFTRNMLDEVRLGSNVRPLSADVVGDVGRVLWVLLGMVRIVLLVACANAANLFLVRAEGRQQELAIRSALGAGRGRIARELLMESVALGLAGGWQPRPPSGPSRCSRPVSRHGGHRASTRRSR